MLENKFFWYSYEESRLRVIPLPNAEWKAEDLSDFLNELAQVGGYSLARILLDFSLNHSFPKPDVDFRARILKLSRQDHSQAGEIKDIVIRGLPNSEQDEVRRLIVSLPQLDNAFLFRFDDQPKKYL